MMQTTLQSLLQDPVLRDIPRKCSLQQLQSLHARELGDVLTLQLVRLDNERIELTVPARNARVCDLKREVQRVIAMREEPMLGRRRLSWRAVWKTWTLASDGRQLTAPQMLLRDAGVRTTSTITFEPHARATKQSRIAKRVMRKK